MKTKIISFILLLAGLVSQASASISTPTPALTELPISVYYQFNSSQCMVYYGVLTKDGIKVNDDTLRTISYTPSNITEERVKALEGKALVSNTGWNYMVANNDETGIDTLANFELVSNTVYQPGQGLTVMFYEARWKDNGKVYTGTIPHTPRVVNVSVRTMVGANGTVIPGFVVQGAPQKVLVRAVGPGMTRFGVPDVAPNPQLRIFQGGNLIGENDDWGGAETIAAIKSTGAFDITQGSKDAALVMTLNPGVYTAVVSEVTGQAGEALVEVYAVPES